MLRINENGEVIVDKPRKLSKRQMHKLKNITNATSRFRYLGSLMGHSVQSDYLHQVFYDLKNHKPDRLKAKYPGSVANINATLLRTDINHVPATNATIDGKLRPEWVGVEIECLIPRSGVESEESAHHRLRNFLSKKKISRCTVKSDGSIRSNSSDDEDDDESDHGDRIGAELTLLFNAKRGYDQLIKLCAALREYGASVNKSCGLHVHFDARHLMIGEVRTIGNKLGYALPVIRWIMPESRQGNSYCKMTVSKTNDDRYCAVNLTAYKKYGTIEVRLHSSTINSEKIINWVELLKQIMRSDISKPINTMQELIDKGCINEALIDYVEKRIEKHWGGTISVMNLLYENNPATTNVAI